MSVLDAKKWKRKIIEQMKKVDTYQDAFMPTIEALAKLLERRDSVYDEFIEDGAASLIEKISDRGAVNRVVNPLLTLWKDLNAQALAYWRDLGLTPAGLKRIDEAAMKKPKESALAKALREVG